MSTLGCFKVPYWEFLVYINNSHVAIKYSEVHHFADDTNLVSFNSCVEFIYKQVHYDLKNLINWLKANKIFLNAGKTELVLFTSPKEQLDCDWKIKLNGKKFYEAPLNISSVIVNKYAVADLLTFTEEIYNGKQFLYSGKLTLSFGIYTWKSL